MKPITRLGKDAVMIFVLLGIIFIPFPFHLFSYQLQFTELIFGSLIRVVIKLFTSESNINSLVYSDSVSMYALVLILLLVALIVSLILGKVKGWLRNRHRIIAVSRMICCYYIALQLLKYGCGKVFKSQFYLPEPNTLFTPLGNLGRDILFWSTMGTSRFYNMFTGLADPCSNFINVPSYATCWFTAFMVDRIAYLCDQFWF